MNQVGSAQSIGVGAGDNIGGTGALVAVIGVPLVGGLLGWWLGGMAGHKWIGAGLGTVGVVFALRQISSGGNQAAVKGP
jgi:hypothetical protein